MWRSTTHSRTSTSVEQSQVPLLARLIILESLRSSAAAAEVSAAQAATIHSHSYTAAAHAASASGGTRAHFHATSPATLQVTSIGLSRAPLAAAAAAIPTTSLVQRHVNEADVLCWRAGVLQQLRDVFIQLNVDLHCKLLRSPPSPSPPPASPDAEQSTDFENSNRDATARVNSIWLEGNLERGTSTAFMDAPTSYAKVEAVTCVLMFTMQASPHGTLHCKSGASLPSPSAAAGSSTRAPVNKRNGMEAVTRADIPFVPLGPPPPIIGPRVLAPLSLDKPNLIYTNTTAAAGTGRPAALYAFETVHAKVTSGSGVRSLSAVDCVQAVSRTDMIGSTAVQQQPRGRRESNATSWACVNDELSLETADKTAGAPITLPMLLPELMTSATPHKRHSSSLQSPTAAIALGSHSGQRDDARHSMTTVGAAALHEACLCVERCQTKGACKSKGYFFFSTETGKPSLSVPSSFTPPSPPLRPSARQSASSSSASPGKKQQQQHGREGERHSFFVSETYARVVADHHPMLRAHEEVEEVTKKVERALNGASLRRNSLNATTITSALPHSNSYHTMSRPATPFATRGTYPGDDDDVRGGGSNSSNIQQLIHGIASTATTSAQGGGGGCSTTTTATTMMAQSGHCNRQRRSHATLFAATPWLSRSDGEWRALWELAELAGEQLAGDNGDDGQKQRRSSGIDSVNPRDMPGEKGRKVGYVATRWCRDPSADPFSGPRASRVFIFQEEGRTLDDDEQEASIFVSHLTSQSLPTSALMMASPARYYSCLYYFDEEPTAPLDWSPTSTALLSSTTGFSNFHPTITQGLCLTVRVTGSSDKDNEVLAQLLKAERVQPISLSM